MDEGVSDLRKRHVSKFGPIGMSNAKMGSFATLVRSESQDTYGANENPSTTNTQIDGSDMDVYSTAGTATDETSHHAEPSLVLLFQVLFPFLVAGIGMVFAGILYNTVQHWDLFQRVPETLILVPSLLGLKGNLEMTLASRLSTQANTGQMDSKEQMISVSMTNIALIQTQAILVTFLATGAAMVFSWIPNGRFDFGHASLLCASSLTTASLASFILSGIMIVVVLLSRKCHVNPDNIATPIAASLGDLITLGILAGFGSLFLSAHETESWLNIMVIAAFMIVLPVWVTIARRDPATASIIRDGWTPIIMSMFISSCAGFVSENAMRQFAQMALYQPVINGVGGNIAAVHASRISTFFHQTATLGNLPFSWTVSRFLSVPRAFFSSEWDSRSARVLLFLVVPGHMFFNWLISTLHTGDDALTSALFTSLYVTAALAQVAILLFVCQWLVVQMWSWKIDPDNAAIPYLTALGDLVGTSFLYLVFEFLSLISHQEVKRADG